MFLITCPQFGPRGVGRPGPRANHYATPVGWRRRGGGVWPANQGSSDCKEEWKCVKVVQSRRRHHGAASSSNSHSRRVDFSIFFFFFWGSFTPPPFPLLPELNPIYPRSVVCGKSLSCPLAPKPYFQFCQRNAAINQREHVTGAVQGCQSALSWGEILCSRRDKDSYQSEPPSSPSALFRRSRGPSVSS